MQAREIVHLFLILSLLLMGSQKPVWCKNRCAYQVSKDAKCSPNYCLQICSSLLPSLPTSQAILFFPWNPYLISCNLTYRFKNIFNAHKIKFCLKSTYPTNCSIKTLTLKLSNPLQIVSTVVISFSLTQVTRLFLLSLEPRRSK